MSVSRRRFVTAAITASVAAPAITACTENPKKPDSNAQFLHGVASGDPLQDRVVIWTRVTTSADNAQVNWQFAEDEGFSSVVASGSLLTDASRDFTVKVDVTGLSESTNYYYRFSSGGNWSTTGRTLTLPGGKPEKFEIGVVSCSNYPAGYFNVYRCLANRDSVDVVLHLGDYMYEYANGQYGDGTQLSRVPKPDKECVELVDYRQRYGSYREDEDLKAVHARHPFILVWDDHEFANNAWLKGAENHSDEEGSWVSRREAATQAYFEWMPIRDSVSDRQHRIYRSFQVGDLFDLIMLDTRITGRDQQLEQDDEEGLNRESRSVLGIQQEHWLAGELSASKQNQSLWRVLGQQIVMAQVLGRDGRVLSTDFWDGYRASRDRLLSQLKQEQIKNNVVLTGDVHSSWANEIVEDPFSPENAQYDSTTGEGTLAVEFVTPAVSSPPAVSPKPEADKSAEGILQSHPHIKYVDFFNRGYMVLNINRQYLTNSWYHIDTVMTPSTNEHLAKQFRVELNRPGLIEV